MADDYNDRIRWREDAARREAGEWLDLPQDAYAAAALGEIARRMGWEGLITDAVSDSIGERMAEEIDRDEWGGEDRWHDACKEVVAWATQATLGELFVELGKAIDANKPVQVTQ